MTDVHLDAPTVWALYHINSKEKFIMKYAYQKQLGRILIVLSIALILGVVATATFTATDVAFAQDGAAVTDTATAEPPTVTPTPIPPTSTSVVPTNTPTTPPPVQIPEPITVVLFGTGLAALSAAAAVRRKNQE
ncbi:MAG: PEP-CTERM sorting domain-containing protein [Caldilineaceae bacterium]|nr:PEP-CTERM sorting domain-containing protein [Caldilineaceae bacterium]